MSNPQQSLYSDSNFWKKARELFTTEVGIKADVHGNWYWVCERPKRDYKDHEGFHWSPNSFPTAKDAEQDLITFLKNYEGFRNG